MKKIKNIEMNLPLILFSILPVSIIIGSSFSLINTILLSLCIVLVYFSRRDVKINDFKPIFLFNNPILISYI